MERYVYFIQSNDGGLIKIGTALDPVERMAAIQFYSPVRLRILAVTEGGRKREHQIHKQFAGARRHGEWFAPVKELREYITQVKNGEEGHQTEYNEASVEKAVMDRIGVHL